MLAAAINVFQFEFRRSLTPARIAMWGALAAFPSALILLMRLGSGKRRISDQGSGGLAHGVLRVGGGDFGMAFLAGLAADIAIVSGFFD